MGLMAAELRHYIFSTTAVEVDFLMLMEQKTSVAAVGKFSIDCSLLLQTLIEKCMGR
jgi:hypothetical protein